MINVLMMTPSEIAEVILAANTMIFSPRHVDFTTMMTSKLPKPAVYVVADLPEEDLSKKEEIEEESYTHQEEHFLCLPRQLPQESLNQQK
jgi:hypothetical protein